MAFGVPALGMFLGAFGYGAAFAVGAFSALASLVSALVLASRPS